MRRIALDPREQAGTVSYTEIHAALRRSPTLGGTRSGGAHTIYIGPRGSVPVPNHAGDCPRGTWRSICRMAIAAGLAALTVVLMATMMI